MDYNFREIEQKWQKRWVENKTYRVVEDKNKKKFYPKSQTLRVRDCGGQRRFAPCPPRKSD